MQTVHLAVKCTVDKVRVCTFSSFVIFSFFDQLGFIMLTFKYSLSHVINFTNIMCTCTLLYKLKSCFQVMVRKKHLLYCSLQSVFAFLTSIRRKKEATKH